MATKILMPKLSDTMTEGVILKWLKKEGDKVKQGEILVEIESDKADMEVEAYDSGVVRKIFISAGEKAPIGSPIAIIAEKNEDISTLLTETPPKESSPPSSSTSASHPVSDVVEEKSALNVDSERKKTSPLARRMARENSINLNSLSGTGPNGRIIKRDIDRFLSEGKPSVQQKLPQPSEIGTVQISELHPIRRTIAARMSESKSTVPHFYVTVEMDMEPAIAYRMQLNQVSEQKISFTDIIIKAVALTLQNHPNVNASYAGDTMKVYPFVHIGVAVALENGLVTPVIRNCELKGIGEINAELRDMADRARNRKLKPEEYQGATFTISNLGMYEVEEFSAIINPPEGAILAISSILEKPVVKNGTIAIGQRMKVTLSSDHRIIDGAIAASFLKDLKSMIEHPASLAL